MGKPRKRERRKQERARAQSGSPYRLIGTQGEVVACYINAGWDEDGKASAFVLRRVPGRGHVMAGYLIDIWCMGLKDAWGRLDASYEEFQEAVAGPRGMGVEFVRVDLDTVRRLVLGGIRFARQNGFRLPPRYERWLPMIGATDDPEHADLTGFGFNGKLCYEGSRTDLEKRLIGCTVDEFLARPDVEFTLDDSDFTLRDDDVAALENTLDELRERGTAAVRQWCFAHGVPPHPRLSEAWDFVFEAMFAAPSAPGDDLDQEVENAEATIGGLLLNMPPSEQADLMAALEQVQSYMTQFDSPEALVDALGLPDDE